MTIRDCYNACLIELNKVLAPSLLLSDFVYLINKNIQEYFNKKYTSFEKILQNTDDLRQLINLTTIGLDAPGKPGIKKNTDVIYGTSYDCPLPADYVHILGCRAVFKSHIKKRCECNNKTHVVGVNKLDTNQAPQVGTNWYMRPSHTRPYYLIINVELGDGLVPSGVLGAIPESKKTSGKRYGNATMPIMLILCGDDGYDLQAVEIQYLLAPRYIKLLQADLDSVEDNSPVLEFSDYVCNEIIKQLVTQIMENGSNPRVLTFTPVNTSIPQN